MKGYVLFKYPGKSPKKFIIGEGSDQVYLCAFLERDPQILTGEIIAYNGKKGRRYDRVSEIPVVTSKEEYLGQFEKFQREFTSQGISKTILSRIKLVNNTLEIDDLFTRLTDRYKTAFCYVLTIEGIGTWAGASPETLLKFKENRIDTVALAGTKYSADPSVWTFKEKEEHGLVEKYIIDLSTEEVPLVHKTDTRVVKAGNLFHLKSEFSFQASKKDISTFLRRIHPTPAICGLPYEASKQLIIETENHDRNLYCGYLGVVEYDSEEFSMYVNIRCMQLIGDKAYLYIGGGITKDSEGESEWEETERKSEVMGSVLG